MVFHGDNTMPLQQSSANGTILRHIGVPPQVPPVSAGGMVGPGTPVTNPAVDPRLAVSGATLQQIHHGQYIHLI
jgi:hypothetical protein